MGIFYNTATGRETNWMGDRRYAGAQYLNVRGKALALLAVAAAGFGIFSDQGLGAWGRSPRERSAQSMDQEAKTKYDLALQQASPSQLFALRFTDTTLIAVSRRAVHGSGIRGVLSNSDDLNWYPTRQYGIKDACLNDTAYDINGGELHFNVQYHGLFSSVEASASGDVPTAAAQASYNPEDHILTIKGGNAKADNLEFDVIGNTLQPADQTTKNILNTYGCKSDVGYSHANIE